MAFVKVARTAEIADGSIQEFTVGGKEIAVANVQGKFHAIDNTCIHLGGPLGQGTVEGNVVTCPWHGWQFDVTTGKVPEDPSVGVSCYQLEVRGEEIFVDFG